MAMVGRLLKAIRRRPRLMAGLLGLLLVSAAAGFYRYALYQWRAAQSALEQGQVAEARNHLQLCLLLWPRSVPVQLAAARAERLGGAFKEAETRLHRCLKLRSGDTADIELEFLLLRVQGGDVDAVEPILWQCVLDHHPQAPLILETLVHAYLLNVRYGPALVCIERWKQEAPEKAKPHDWRGWILERLGDRTNALKNYRAAIDLDSDFVPARFHLVELYLQLSSPEDALPHLLHLQQQIPDRPEVLARLGHCRFLQGRIEEARSLLESAVEKLPNDIPTLIQLGHLDLQSGRPQRAEQWLRRALAIDPTDTQTLYQLANSLEAQNRSEEVDAVRVQSDRIQARLLRANKLLREATQHPVSDPNALSELGRIFLENRQERLGVYWLNQALEQDSSHQPALRALADYYEKNGQQEKAGEYRHKLKPRNEDGSVAKQS